MDNFKIVHGSGNTSHQQRHQFDPKNAVKVHHGIDDDDVSNDNRYDTIQKNVQASPSSVVDITEVSFYSPVVFRLLPCNNIKPFINRKKIILRWTSQQRALNTFFEVLSEMFYSPRLNLLASMTCVTLSRKEQCANLSCGNYQGSITFRQVTWLHFGLKMFQRYSGHLPCSGTILSNQLIV